MTRACIHSRNFPCAAQRLGERAGAPPRRQVLSGRTTCSGGLPASPCARRLLRLRRTPGEARGGSAARGRGATGPVLPRGHAPEERGGLLHRSPRAARGRGPSICRSDEVRARGTCSRTQARFLVGQPECSTSASDEVHRRRAGSPGSRRSACRKYGMASNGSVSARPDRAGEVLRLLVEREGRRERGALSCCASSQRRSPPVHWMTRESTSRSFSGRCAESRSAASQMRDPGPGPLAARLRSLGGA